MRSAFFKELETIYEKDERIIVLTGDLGFKLFDNYRRIDKKRFYDVGVAEANMIGLAAGLALCGFKVFCYSIVPFLIMRAFEQIRNDVDWHNLDVKLVGVGGGISYGLEGISHHGLEDIAIMRVLPNMTIVVPADPLEAAVFARLSCQNDGPMYIRLCHTNDPRVHKSTPEIIIGEPLLHAEGKEAMIIATGRMVHTAIQAKELLKEDGIDCGMTEMHTLKPIDKKRLIEILESKRLLVTVEEHSLEGGLGSIIAEIIAERSLGCRLIRLGVDRKFRYIGPADHLRVKYGLSAGNIANIIRGELLNEKG